MSVAFVPAQMCSCCSEEATARRSGVSWTPKDLESPLKACDPQARGIISEVLLATGTRPSILFSGLQDRHTSHVRALIATRIRLELGYGYEKIGIILGRHHSSLIAAVKRIRKEVQT